MKSLYGQYIEEREEQEILETKYGFVSYRIYPTQYGNQIFICDIYVDKTSRGLNESKDLIKRVTKIALDNNCTSAMSTVDPNTKTATIAMKFQLSCGMQLSHTSGGLIYMWKPLNKTE